jgi:serine/threonine protein kinase
VFEAFLNSDLVQPARSLRTGVRYLILNGASFCRSRNVLAASPSSLLMNRSVDSRSDLYALGVTFYEMLTGRLSFTAVDPMEWVHCHIARQPVPPTEQVAGVPGPLSAIVMKLLAKTAET